MKTLKSLKTGLLSLGLALLVPGAAFAQTSSLADAVEPKITEMIADVVAVSGVIVMVVLAVVGAKVIFSMLRKA